MRASAMALVRFGERHAERARELAAQESDPQRKAELEKILRQLREEEVERMLAA